MTTGAEVREAGCSAPEASGAGSSARATGFTNLCAGDYRVRACVCGLGIDVSGDSRGNRIVPATPAGRFSSFADRFHSVPYPALEDRRAADSGTVAYVLHYGLLTVVRWKRRRLPGRTYGSFGSRGAACRDGFVVDGSH